MRLDGQVGEADVFTRVDEYLLPDVDVATAFGIGKIKLFDPVDAIALVPRRMDLCAPDSATSTSQPCGVVAQ